MATARLITPLARAAAALAVVAAGAAPLAAQSRRALFAWDGRVDREVLLVMRRGGVETRYSGGDDRGRLRVGSALPRTAGYVNVRLVRGRGDVDVVQQPNANNDYTAVVRVRDDQSGAGDYRLQALWQPANGGYADGGYDHDGGYSGDDDDRGRDNNGRGWGWGRDRDRDRDRDNDGRDDREERRRNRRRDRDGDGDYDRNDRDIDDRGTRGSTRGGWGGILGRTGNAGDASGALRWSGRVDDVQEVRIRGRRASTYTVSGGGASDVRTSVSGSGLSGGARVRVRTFDGRGNVRVVEQPSARNGYTAVVRVEDRQGGAGFYDFEASWY